MSPKKETLTVNVVDAAGGILEICCRDYWGGKFRAVIRQHSYEGGEAQFINVQIINLPPEKAFPGYIWGQFVRAGSAPDHLVAKKKDQAFENLAMKGDIAGKWLKDSDGKDESFLIEPLSKDTLDKISIDSGRLFFNYQHKGEGGLEDAVELKTCACGLHRAHRSRMQAKNFTRRPVSGLAIFS